ncbi:MAG TPA: TM2 domain-containing protein [Ferruginibacter sp.]|jgi:TM2 domain-containing membrane protein YozV|nr:TM2 domain-containing protein [Ferruginibacter sp.]
MEQQKIDMFIASMASKFPGGKLMLIRNQLEKVDDNKLLTLQSLEYKDPTTILIVSIFLGHLGIDRFMLGQTGLGLGKLFTCGGLGIWALIDWFLIMDATREANFQKFTQFAF